MIILIRTTQVFIFEVFLRKDPHVNAVEWGITKIAMPASKEVMTKKYRIKETKKCNAIDKIIFNMDNKTLSLKCERSFS